MKLIYRDTLGLILIVSTVFFLMGMLLDVLGALAYVSHEEIIASTLIHESLPMLPLALLSVLALKLISRLDPHPQC